MQYHNCSHCYLCTSGLCTHHATEGTNLALGVIALGVLVAHTVVGLETAHGNFCVSGPIHGPLIDVG